MTVTTDPTLLNLYENALRDIAEVLAESDNEAALAALTIAGDALAHRLDEMEAES